jgi:hypothetical protein
MQTRLRFVITSLKSIAINRKCNVKGQTNIFALQNKNKYFCNNF